MEMKNGHKNDSDDCDEKVNVMMEMLEVLVGVEALGVVMVRGQQRGDPEPSRNDKIKALQAMFHKSPSNFLHRFGSHIPHHFLQAIFVPIATTDANVAYILETHIPAMQHPSPETHQQLVRNRRYRKLELMKKEGDGFFSEDSMKRRCPWLYDQFVGRFLTDAEVSALTREQGDARTWSSQLLHQVINQDMTQRMKADQKEAHQTWEEDSRALSATRPDMHNSFVSSDAYLGTETHEERLIEQESVTEEERAQYRSEFVKMMEERFLRGEDADFFDYTTVDNNKEYDDITRQQQDAESSYFDTD